VPFFATIDRRFARLPSPPGDPALAKCSGMESYRSTLMQPKTLLTVKTLLAERRELITNWLAVLALLAVGVV
jgi:hypothetical protein